MLESRELMAYSPYGVSLPDLIVSGSSSGLAAWGQPLSVSVNVHNIGASSMVEPTQLEQGATSSADAAATVVNVLASRVPNPGKNASVLVGQFAVPAVPQNGTSQISGSITLPNRPAGYPGNGGRIYLTYVVNPGRNVLEYDPNNNITASSNPVRLTAALPELAVTSADIPTDLQPGDSVAPTVTITNFGTANPNLQGPVAVQLVASLDRNFGPGDTVISSFSIGSLPGINSVPSTATVNGTQSIVPPANSITQTFPIGTLPSTPRKYYIGVVIDPTKSIKQLSPPTSRLAALTPVGFTGANSIRSNVLNASYVPAVFPTPPSPIVLGTISSGSLPDNSGLNSSTRPAALKIAKATLKKMTTVKLNGDKA